MNLPYNTETVAVLCLNSCAISHRLSLSRDLTDWLAVQIGYLTTTVNEGVTVLGNATDAGVQR